MQELATAETIDISLLLVPMQDMQDMQDHFCENSGVENFFENFFEILIFIESVPACPAWG